MTQRENSAAAVARVMLDEIRDLRSEANRRILDLEQSWSDALTERDTARAERDEARAARDRAITDKAHEELARVTAENAAREELARVVAEKDSTIAALRVSLDTAAKTCEALRADLRVVSDAFGGIFGTPGTPNDMIAEIRRLLKVERDLRANGVANVDCALKAAANRAVDWLIGYRQGGVPLATRNALAAAVRGDR